MSRNGSPCSLHHDLRGALSAVRMNLQTLEALEAGEGDVSREKRLAVVERAKTALTEAVELADQIQNEDSGSAGRRS